MSENYKVQDQDQPYFITFAVESWVNVFTRKMYRDGGGVRNSTYDATSGYFVPTLQPSSSKQEEPATD
jgi:hypothetical protein